MQTNELNRVGFLHLPTPLERLSRLPQAVGTKCPLFVKRDDTTTVGLGGNKTRKLEYVAADALKKGADTLITWGGIQSNHCRQTAAYAAKLGMACHLVLNGRPSPEYQGNVLLFDLYGAQLHFEEEEDSCPDACLNLAKALTEEGRKPYYIGIGASSPLGVLGYVDCAREIQAQAAKAGVEITDVFLPSGTGGTQAGLILGFHGTGVRVHGISVSSDEKKQKGKLRRVLTQTCEAFPDQFGWTEEELLVDDRFVGAGYAIPSQQGNAAIRLLGRTEALTLDPVYTGKAMAGMLDWLASEESRWAKGVVFVHTGGSPAIFRFADEMQASAARME